jgi:LysM repeat protein
MPTYTVQQGDCISSIAAQYGFLWDTIWQHPDNADLRAKRHDPNVLYPGDEIVIPEKMVKEVSRPTGRMHEFVKPKKPTKLKLRLLRDYDKPRANLPYQLEIDGNVLSGVTDGDGFLEHPIPPNASRGVLTVKEKGTDETYQLGLGTLDPHDTDDGVRGRLVNLGIGGDTLQDALRAFQQKEGLTVTGEADDATRGRLKEKFGQ